MMMWVVWFNASNDLCLWLLESGKEKASYCETVWMLSLVVLLVNTYLNLYQKGDVFKSAALKRQRQPLLSLNYYFTKMSITGTNVWALFDAKDTHSLACHSYSFTGWDKWYSVPLKFWKDAEIPFLLGCNSYSLGLFFFIFSFARPELKWNKL